LQACTVQPSPICAQEALIGGLLQKGVSEGKGLSAPVITNYKQAGLHQTVDLTVELASALGGRNFSESGNRETAAENRTELGEDFRRS
jgi:hypothetical protein